VVYPGPLEGDAVALDPVPPRGHGVHAVVALLIGQSVCIVVAAALLAEVDELRIVPGEAHLGAPRHSVPSDLDSGPSVVPPAVQNEHPAREARLPHAVPSGAEQHLHPEGLGRSHILFVRRRRNDIEGEHRAVRRHRHVALLGDVPILDDDLAEVSKAGNRLAEHRLDARKKRELVVDHLEGHRRRGILERDHQLDRRGVGH